MVAHAQQFPGKHVAPLGHIILIPFHLVYAHTSSDLQTLKIK